MSGPERIVVKPRAGISKEAARNLRAAAWRYVFDCYEKRKAAGEDGGENDGTETKEGSAYGIIRPG